MARPGRKRKPAVARDKKGRIASTGQRERTDNARASVISYRVKHGANPAHVLDQRQGYELGRLAIAGTITDAQHDAGLAYTKLVSKIRGLMLTPRATCAASSGEGGGGRPLRPDMDPDESASIHRRYNAAYVALAGAGRPAIMAVNDCAVRDEPAEIQPLRNGLTALRRHFRIPDYDRRS